MHSKIAGDFHFSVYGKCPFFGPQTVAGCLTRRCGTNASGEKIVDYSAAHGTSGTPAMATRIAARTHKAEGPGGEAWPFHRQGESIAGHEHPLVEPQVSHFRQVPLRTIVKLPHSEQLSPS